MAKSKEQKRMEAQARGRAYYAQHIKRFMLFSPLHPLWDGSLYDFCFWLESLHSMRKVALELNIHYDGTDTWSTDRSWTTEALVKQLFNSREIVQIHRNMKKVVEDMGEECSAFEANYDQLAIVMPRITELFDHASVKECFQKLI